MQGEQDKEQIENTITENIRESLQTLKTCRSKEARAAMQAISTAASSTTATKGKTSAVAKRLSVGRKRIGRASALRTKCLSGENASWVCTEVATRHGIAEELRKAASDFWTRPGTSRPTGNKNDIKRNRIGPKTYVEHEILILEKSQSEVYQDFRQYVSAH